jgi:hypothetical protein
MFNTLLEVGIGLVWVGIGLSCVGLGIGACVMAYKEFKERD